GYIREAVVNFVALLGWSPAGDREIYSLPELVKIFDYHRINKSPAVFDMTKLNWMNGEYIKAMDDDTFFGYAEPYLKKYVKRDLDLRKISAMVRTRIQVLPEIGQQVDFFNEVPDYSTEMYVHKKSKSTKESSLAVLRDVIPLLEAQEKFDGDSLFEVLKAYAAEKGYKVNTVMWPIRTALSGKEATPAGATGLLEVLGREESLNRLRAAVEKLETDV
ncbi:MAG: glutamate--tRNA ligase family protein, partial [Lachnospiraceae bacterium]|nr:glutamate--tRNA ligase family protein [Lachnospiraceae bacterium]